MELSVIRDSLANLITDSNFNIGTSINRYVFSFNYTLIAEINPPKLKVVSELPEGEEDPIGNFGEMDTTVYTIRYVFFPFMHHVLHLVVLCLVFG